MFECSAVSDRTYPCPEVCPDRRKTSHKTHPLSASTCIALNSKPSFLDQRAAMRGCRQEGMSGLLRVPFPPEKYTYFRSGQNYNCLQELSRDPDNYLSKLLQFVRLALMRSVCDPKKYSFFNRVQLYTSSLSNAVMEERTPAESVCFVMCKFASCDIVMWCFMFFVITLCIAYCMRYCVAGHPTCALSFCANPCCVCFVSCYTV